MSVKLPPLYQLNTARAPKGEQNGLKLKPPVPPIDRRMLRKQRRKFEGNKIFQQYCQDLRNDRNDRFVRISSLFDGNLLAYGSQLDLDNLPGGLQELPPCRRLELLPLPSTLLVPHWRLVRAEGDEGGKLRKCKKRMNHTLACPAVKGGGFEDCYSTGGADRDAGPSRRHKRIEAITRQRDGLGTRTQIMQDLGWTNNNNNTNNDRNKLSQGGGKLEGLEHYRHQDDRLHRRVGFRRHHGEQDKEMREVNSRDSTAQFDEENALEVLGGYLRRSKSWVRLSSLRRDAFDIHFPGQPLVDSIERCRKAQWRL
ncbi:hypothetical protein CBR_g4109 [Chara braunii]|uniref:Uncharacterized protein n=1 Tax=Chara braunii TaxID=69332 RepID=A0A388KH66_CHABU|nr:hypothetical protein CBR_g4109 [Chara braunii]|eukprot:GBG69414.1 hypothetical protein CBR_g4109 [Chara braunii]